MNKIVLIITLFVFSIFSAQKSLPKATLKDLDGNKVTTTALFAEKDKIYVIPFWATWCAPCLEELEALNGLADEWKSEINYEIAAVSVDDARTVRRVKPLINGKGWTFKVLLDTNQELKRKLGIANVPYLVVMKNGVIKIIKNGHNPGGEAELLKELKKL